MSVEEKIITALKSSGGELSMAELVTKVQETESVRPSIVKAAVLPLISTDKVDLTPDLKLHLRSDK